MSRLRPLLGPAFDFGAPVVAYDLLRAAGVGTVVALVAAAALPALSVAVVTVRPSPVPPGKGRIPRRLVGSAQPPDRSSVERVATWKAPESAP